MPSALLSVTRIILVNPQNNPMSHLLLQVRNVRQGKRSPEVSQLVSIGRSSAPWLTDSKIHALTDLIGKLVWKMFLVSWRGGFPISPALSGSHQRR